MNHISNLFEIIIATQVFQVLMIISIFKNQREQYKKKMRRMKMRFLARFLPILVVMMACLCVTGSTWDWKCAKPDSVIAPVDLDTMWLVQSETYNSTWTNSKMLVYQLGAKGDIEHDNIFRMQNPFKITPPTRIPDADTGLIDREGDCHHEYRLRETTPGADSNNDGKINSNDHRRWIHEVYRDDAERVHLQDCTNKLDGDDMGYCSIKFSYPLYQQYRPEREGKILDFRLEMWIHGHNVHHEKKAHFDFQIKFVRNCNTYGLKWADNNQVHDLNMLNNTEVKYEYTVGTAQGLKIQMPPSTMWDYNGINKARCNYENTRTAAIFYVVENQSSLPDATSGSADSADPTDPADPDSEPIEASHEVLMPASIMTYDQATRQIKIHVLKDRDVWLEDFEGTGKSCDLSLLTTQSCEFKLVIREYGPDGPYGNPANGTVTLKSECYRLNLASQQELNEFWSWPSDQEAIVRHGYRLRDPPISFYLPIVQPKLDSNDYFYDRCGPIQYSIAVEPFPVYFNETYSDVENGTVGIFIEAWSEDELLVKDHKPHFYTLWGKRAKLQAKLDLYPDVITYTNPIDLTFKLSDYCLGWYMSPRNITIENERSIVSKEQFDLNWPSGRPTMWLSKYVLSPETVFDFSYLNYTQMMPDSHRVDYGCGNVRYHPQFWTDPDDYKKDLVTIQEEGDYEQKNGLRFHVYAPTHQFKGEYIWNITVDSDILEYEPQPEFQVVITILPCYVERVNTFQQTFEDVIAEYETVTRLVLEPFVQVPLCNYTETYTITLFEKELANSSQPLFDNEFEGQMFGNPPLVYLDLSEKRLVIDANDFLLINKTFTVYIFMHVKVDKIVQQTMWTKLPPFDISVVSDAKIFAPPNAGPTIVGWEDEINIYAGMETRVNLGKPIDIEGDEFILKEWLIEGDKVPWIQFNNATSQKRVDFTFNPPAEAAGQTFYVLLHYLDNNLESQGVTDKELTINVKDFNSSFIPNFNSTKKEKRKEVKPVILEEEKRSVSVKINDLTSAGLLKIDFSDKVGLPLNLTGWTNENEGADYLDIKYSANDISEVFFEDLQIKQFFAWKVDSVDFRNLKPSRRLQEANETVADEQQPQNVNSQIVAVDSITVQMQWSNPLYVSQNIQQDDMSVEIEPKLFEHDPEIEITKDEVYKFRYNGKAPQQVSAGQLMAIESVEGAAGGALQVFMGTNFFLSFFMIGVLQFLWGLINTLQMIMFTVLFSVNFPLNASKIMIAIMKLTNLDIIDTEAILTTMWGFKIETDPISPIFEEAGYESSNFIIELGPIFLIICLSMLIFICKRLCTKVTENCRENCLTRRLRQRHNLVVIIVRFLIESCIEVGLVALISARMIDKDRFGYLQDGTAMILAFIALAGLIITPFYLLHAGKKLLFRPDIMEDQEKKDTELLFEAYRIDDINAVRFGAIFFFRRFLMLFVLIMLPGQRNVQIVAQMWSTLYIMSYTAYVLPYKDRVQNVQEVFNEITVLIASYHLLVFTEWVWDMERRFEAGWSLIALIVINVCFNFAVLAVFVIKDSIRKTKLKYLKKRQTKNIVEQRKRVLEQRGHLVLTLDSIPKIAQIGITKQRATQGNQLLQLESISEEGSESVSSSFSMQSELIEAKLKPGLLIQAVSPIKPFVDDALVEAKHTTGYKSIYADHMTDFDVLKNQQNHNSYCIEEEKVAPTRPSFSQQSRDIPTKPKRSLNDTLKLQALLKTQIMAPAASSFTLGSIEYNGHSQENTLQRSAEMISTVKPEQQLAPFPLIDPDSITRPIKIFEQDQFKAESQKQTSPLFKRSNFKLNID